MEIRRAGAGDLPAIERIQSSSPEASQWQVADYLSYDCVVAEHEGAVAGFLVSRKVGGEREILNLAIAPERRRTGVGRALLAHELGSAAEGWFLEVRQSNQAAIAMYESAGFERSGERRNYYENPRESAIVMRILS